ncbi:MAG: hypothetical protein IBJ10_00390 [Phycisphaerales bacterium]|nr:hypothetical protein [Phycisphaerales bacterium]
MSTQSIRTLLSGIVDYAGLFPPAKLDMAPTVRNYAAHRAGRHAWMLGRLVLPTARLGECAEAIERLCESPGPEEAWGGVWRITALVAGAGERDKLRADLDAAHAFNDRYAPADDEAEPVDDGEAPLPRAGMPALLVDCIETKADNPNHIDSALHVIPEGLQAFFEIPIDRDPRGLVTALAGEPGVGAKVRTGGVTPEAFPTVENLARFIGACAAASTPFKATAGLHHPLRAEHRLTYEPNPPRATMFGFLNVFLAAALAQAEHGPPGALAAMLDESSADALRFGDLGVAWKSVRLDNARLARARETLALSFGSCSFEEPVQDLRAMGLLE